MRDHGGEGVVSRRFVLLACALIVLLGFSLYHRSLSYGLTYSDDDVLVDGGMEFIGEVANLPKAFTTDAWYGHQGIELYRPLQTVSYILDAARGRDVLFQLHLTGLLLHLLCCIVLFLLLLRMGLSKYLALLGGLIYVSHYLFLHTVIWIPARGDLLLALFSFGSHLALVEALESGRKRFYLANLLLFALALFSKETAVMLPLLFVLWFALSPRRTAVGRVHLATAGGYAAVLAAYFPLRGMSVAPAAGSFGPAGVIHNLPTIPETIAKFFIPVNFSTMPSFHLGASLAGLGILAAWVALAVALRRKPDRLTIFGAAWFLLLILPSLAYQGRFSISTYDYLDHRSYLLGLGILLVVLDLLRGLRAGTGRAFAVACVAVPLYLSGVNLMFSRAYEDPLAYSDLAVRTNPRSALAHFIRGNAFHRRGEEGEAMRHFDRALEISPDFKDALYNRALLNLFLRNYRESLRDLDRIVLLDGGADAVVYHARGVARAWQQDDAPDDPGRQARIDEAMKDLDRAILIDPGYGEALYNRASLNLSRGRYREALDDLDRVLLLDPGSGAPVHNARGIARAALGDCPGALEEFNRALAIDPGFTEAERNRAACLERKAPGTASSRREEVQDRPPKPRSH